MTITDPIVGIGLDPATTGRVYRDILAAYARPGLEQMLPATDFPAALLPSLALTDLDTGVDVVETDGRHWLDVVTVATGAPAMPADRARYVTLLRTPTPDDLLTATRGSALSPESAATVVCEVASLRGGVTVELTGPGVKEVERISPSGFDEQLWRARNEATADFPAGIDLLIIADDGAMVGIPRTTRVVVIAEEN